MRIAFVSTFDAKDVLNWSGTPFYMSTALEKEARIDYIGPLKHKINPLFKLKQYYQKMFLGYRNSGRYHQETLKYYSAQVAKKLAQLDAEAILAPLIQPIAFLESNKPIILWTDALYAGLLGFYSNANNSNAKSITEGNLVTQECLSRCRLTIFSSAWAANTARELYGISREKIKIVPYGANIDSHPDQDEITKIVKNRSQQKIKLLFLAKDWHRKGGDIALAVAKELHETGHAVELTIIGNHLQHLKAKLPYVNYLGFVTKKTTRGRETLSQLLSESHFLILPSRADACPMVLAEANAFGLPCITTSVGGIRTAIKDGENGQTFSLFATTQDYCNFIVNQMTHRQDYEKLAFSSYHEYLTRLNWQVAARTVKTLIQDHS